MEEEDDYDYYDFRENYDENDWENDPFGVEDYEESFRALGVLNLIQQRLHERYSRFRYRILKRCLHCQKRMWFKPLEEVCCCQKCYDEWVPF